MQDKSELELKLDSLALELFEGYQPEYAPAYPFLYVRILPREMKLGAIWLPDAKGGNKPVHEAIVLRTWQPFWDHLRDTKEDDGAVIHRDVLRTSQFSPGDHILVPHWAGQALPFGPVGGETTQEVYRAIPETLKYGNENGPILGKIGHTNVNIEEELRHLVNYEVGDSGADLHYDSGEFVRELLSKYEITMKITSSSTTSGGQRT